MRQLTRILSEISKYDTSQISLRAYVQSVYLIERCKSAHYYNRCFFRCKAWRSVRSVNFKIQFSRVESVCVGGKYMANITSFLSDGFRIISHGDSYSTEYLRSVRREDRDSKFNNLPSELVVCSRNFKQSLSLGSVLYGKISVSSRLKLRKIGGLSLTCIDKRGEEN